MAEEKECACQSAPRLVFACSGAADVGEIADKAARRMNEKGWADMFCLAGVGGRVSGILKSTEAARAVLAIDGCPLNCAKNCLEQAGFKQFEHVCLEELGMKKGKTPATQEKVDAAAMRGAEKLGCS